MIARIRQKRIPRRTDIWPRLWRRRPVTAVVVLLLVLWLTWQRTSTPGGSDLDRYHKQTFLCVKVVDGDTIDIAAPDGNKPDTRIRLWGVDTPETGKSPSGAMYFGAQASDFTCLLVQDKPVYLILVSGRTRGKYGRLLAYVYSEDRQTMLNEELVAQGYAYADPRFDHPWKQLFRDLEERARKKKLGLWKEVKPEQYPAWRQRYENWKDAQQSSSGQEASSNTRP
jgi:micrococcal nuclease